MQYLVNLIKKTNHEQIHEEFYQPKKLKEENKTTKPKKLY